MHIQIKDADEDEELNKLISSVILDEVKDNNLESTITFEMPRDITADITEPDVLFFYFEKPELILDAETKEPLEVN